MERDRIGELDGLRAIAVLIVVIWHYFGTPDGPEGWPWKVLHVGRFGVDLFFVLSGYLITDILLRHRAAERYYSAFYGRRAFRIWPLYYLMCATALIGWCFSLSPDLFDTRGVPGWLYLFGLQNFGMAKAQTDGVYWLAVTWSLAIEEQFYLLFPLLVRNVPPERLFAILLVPILICPIGRLIDSALPDAYGWYVLPQFRIDSLAIGALIAWWRIYRKPDAELSRRVARILKWSSLSLPLLWLFGWKRWSVAFSHTQVEIFFGALLFVVLENRGAPRLALLRSSVATFFARTSYAAYLTHHVIVYLLFAVLHRPRTVESLAGMSLTLGAFALTFGLCALSYRYFERPLLDFAHRRFSFG